MSTVVAEEQKRWVSGAMRQSATCSLLIETAAGCTTEKGNHAGVAELPHLSHPGSSADDHRHHNFTSTFSPSVAADRAGGLFTGDADASVHTRKEIASDAVAVSSTPISSMCWMDDRGSRVAGVRLFIFQTRPKYARHRGELNAQQDLDTDNVNRR